MAKCVIIMVVRNKTLSCLDDVKQIGNLGVYCAVVASCKGVFLTVGKDIAQTIEIAAFKGETMTAFCTEFRTQTAGYSVFETIVNFQTVLLYDIVGSAA